MKKGILFPGTMLIAALLSLSPLQAKDVVVNDGFETQGWHYWEPSGTIPSAYLSIPSFAVTGPGNYSMCFDVRSWDGVSGGLIQKVYVEAGVTYDVRADFAYELC
ncbi:MAG: hypothetical protein ABIK28_01730 [Planctomycetota bacterium]